MTTTTAENRFYANDVLVDDFDYTVVEDPETARRVVPAQPTVRARVLRTVAAMATSGVLVFGPLGLVSPVDPTTGEERPLDSVIVRVRAPEQHGVPTVGHVAVPESHAAAAKRFRQMFRAVPLNRIEKLPDPDFGL